MGSLAGKRDEFGTLAEGPKVAEYGETMSDQPNGFRILIVDDNAAAADSLAKLLALRGNLTHAVYLGRDAIVEAPVFAPEVVLLDIGLPDMEGYDVAQALRTVAELADTTLIALTGFGQDSDIERARKAGFDHHLTKPASLADIEAILAGVPRSAKA